ncbi:MAG: hypothetical protein QM628_05075 [Propionicimonas sp.]
MRRQIFETTDDSLSRRVSSFASLSTDQIGRHSPSGLRTYWSRWPVK